MPSQSIAYVFSPGSAANAVCITTSMSQESLVFVCVCVCLCTCVYAGVSEWVTVCLCE
jgi:hypothetical protein